MSNKVCCRLKYLHFNNLFFYQSLIAGSPYLNHFIQPDTLISDPSNPQAWNRFSYVKNNPISFNDPTGHIDNPPPWVDTINPFSFDTWFISIRGALKYYVGVEGDVTLYVDMKPIKQQGLLGLDDVKISVNLEGGVSLGFSTQLKGAAVVGSTKGRPEDQKGVNMIGLNQYSTNLAGCAPELAMCGGLKTVFDKQLKPTSKGVMFGLGEGYDISLDLVNISDSFLEASKDKIKVQIPFVNKNFFKKASDTFRSLRKAIGY